MRPARPRARGEKRFMTSPLPTWASATTRSSTSRSWLFSALAIADSRHLRTSLAMRLRENCRSASAVTTALPRISAATRLSFCGLTRMLRATALASLSARLRSRFFLPMSVPRLRTSGARGGGSALGLAVGRMAIERAGRRELAELVADHLLRHQHRNVLLPIVDAERQPDELRQDGGAAAPDLDHLMAARRARGFRLLEQIAVNERALPNRTSHGAALLLLPRMAAGNDELGGRLVLAGLLALGREAPRRDRMATARGAACAAPMRVIDRVHRHAAIVRTPAEPAGAAGLADRDVHVVGVRHGADRGHAAPVHQALLGRVEAQDHVFLVAPDDLRVGPG